MSERDQTSRAFLSTHRVAYLPLNRGHTRNGWVYWFKVRFAA
jgi:hypothetical protein